MTTAEAILEMMNGWNVIEANAKASFPNATKDELFQICKEAMNRALKSKN